MADTLVIDDAVQLVTGKKFGDATDYSEFDSGALKMHEKARVYVTTTINFDHTTVAAHGKPTLVTRGIHKGFSLPVYAADNEELFSCKSAKAI